LAFGNDEYGKHDHMALWTNQGYVTHFTSLREFVNARRCAGGCSQTRNERYYDQFLSRLRSEALEHLELQDEPDRYILCDINLDHSSGLNINGWYTDDFFKEDNTITELHTFVSFRREENRWVLEKALLAMVYVPFEGMWGEDHYFAEEHPGYREMEEFLEDETTQTFLAGNTFARKNLICFE